MAIDGGPAFPQIEGEVSVDSYGATYMRIVMTAGGMSLRDWFAGQALALGGEEHNMGLVE